MFLTGCVYTAPEHTLVCVMGDPVSSEEAASIVLQLLPSPSSRGQTQPPWRAELLLGQKSSRPSQ
eukprot:4069368-Amphidinium_carterae.1